MISAAEMRERAQEVDISFVGSAANLAGTGQETAGELLALRAESWRMTAELAERLDVIILLLGELRGGRESETAETQGPIERLRRGKRPIDRGDAS